MNRQVFTGIISGIIGGIAIVLIFSYDPELDAKIKEKLLDWPFLIFILILLIISIYHNGLKELISKGNITIKKGETAISITQAIEEVNKEVDNVDTDLENKIVEIESWLQDIQDQIENLAENQTVFKNLSDNYEKEFEKRSRAGGEFQIENNSVENIRNIVKTYKTVESKVKKKTSHNEIKTKLEIDDDNLIQFILLLTNTIFRLRKENTLARLTGFSPEYLSDLYSNNKNFIEMKFGGRQKLYGLSESARNKLLH